MIPGELSEAEQAAVDAHRHRVAGILQPQSDDGLTPDQRAERDAHLVQSSDQVVRAAAGKEDPPEGHDVRDYLPAPPEAEGPDRDALKEEIKAELLAELRTEMNT